MFLLPLRLRARMTQSAGASTTAIHGGLSPDPHSGALVQPLVQSTTFVNEAVGVTKGHAYSRA